MSNKVLLFAGTTEGRLLADVLVEQRVESIVCVTTGYGEQLLRPSSYQRVHTGVMDEVAMYNTIVKEGITCVIDATHPYADRATAHIKKACERSGRLYYRVARSKEPYQGEGIIEVATMQEAAAYLEQTTGNILLTTGSKELAVMQGLTDYKKRIYARILPSPTMLQKCLDLGYEQRQIICMQGPFSKAMNQLMLEEMHICYMVTKESGQIGGFKEKREAAKAVGVTLIVMKRPEDTAGHSVEVLQEMITQLGGEG